LGKARDFYRRAVDMAQRRDLKEVAAGFVVESAVREAVFGDCQQIEKKLNTAFAFDLQLKRQKS